MRHNWDVYNKWRDEYDLSYKGLQDMCTEAGIKPPSKGLIAYHWGADQKAKTQGRQKKHRATPHGRIGGLVDSFKRKPIMKPAQDLVIYSKDIARTWRDRAHHFQGKETTVIRPKWTTQDLIDKVWDKDTRLDDRGNAYPTSYCYLTGDTVDCQATTTHLDHVDNSAGNGLDNAAWACKRANEMKNDMTLAQLNKLCAKILRAAGWSVSPPT